MNGKIPITAVVDIGKTNKKFFLFDENLDEVDHEYIRFPEIPDDDGFESEDLGAVVKWMQECVHRLLQSDTYELKSLNFSTYGASFVHLKADGSLAVPFYNYLKPMPEGTQEQFLVNQKLNKDEFQSVSSSPLMGFLNSGFQLYYLKHFKVEKFKSIDCSLHFPQYLSYIFTQQKYSEYTSIGCHTGLWDFYNNSYHPWVKNEGVEGLLPAIVPSNHLIPVKMEGKEVNIGVGVHDSSSALVPYIQASAETFVLISTGTWSICMNYFNEDELSVDDLEKDCLNFLSIKGTNIKASRLFLGKHTSNQAKLLSDHFEVEYSSYKTAPYNPDFVSKRKDAKELLLDHTDLHPERFGFKNGRNENLSLFDDYFEAYHQLMDELTDIQIASLKLAIGNTDIKTIYVDGGFSSNEVFMQMLANKLPDYSIYGSSFAKGTALGAALLGSETKLPKDYLHTHYNLKLHKPLG